MITISSLIQFGRPHTLIGTTLQCITSYWIPTFCYSTNPWQTLLTNFPTLLAVWLTSLCINIWAVGFNQLIDHDLDKVNKPDLPLPAGIMSRREAWILSIGCGIVGVLASLFQGPILSFVIIFVLLVTTAYSLPSIFLKGRPLYAALAISFSRGLVGHLGTFLHFSSVLYHHHTIPTFIYMFATFTFFYGLAIAILKDVPDMDGDAQFKVMTLAVRLGGRRVFQLAISMLTVGYLALTISALSTFPLAVSGPITVCHIFAISAMWYRFNHFAFTKKTSNATYQFYMDIWKGFYAEFIIVCGAVAFRSASLIEFS